MDNIIFYHPKTDDNNKQMNTVGMCVACACICERFSLRSDNLELADEIQTDLSVTVLFSPQREVWVAAEVDPSVDTLSMRLIIEKAVGGFLMLHGPDGLNIEAPPHKRYVAGSDEAYERRLEKSNDRKVQIEMFFRDFIEYLTTFALISLPPLGANHTFRIRAASDALMALPTVIPPLDVATFLRFETLCAKYELFLTCEEADIREALLGPVHVSHGARGASSMASASTSTVDTALDPSIANRNTTSAGLQFVVGCVDDCRLLFSSAPDSVSHKLLFLARTQIRLLETMYKKGVNTIHWRDAKGNNVTQSMLFAHRSGYVVFILGGDTGTSGKDNASSLASWEYCLNQIVSNRLSIVADMLVCVEILSSHAFGAACEVRAASLAKEKSGITDALIGASEPLPSSPAPIARTNSAMASWAQALGVPLTAPKDTATTTTLFSPSPLSLMLCLPDAPISFTARSPRDRLYPCATDIAPVPRCSDTLPTVVGFNRGFVYGSPLASLPRMAQVAIAHYMGELWRNHYASFNDSAFNYLHQNTMNIPTPAHETADGCVVDDETIRHFNQHYAHEIVSHVNSIRFHGRAGHTTGGCLGGAPSLTLPTLLVDGEKDISDVWIPIAVRSVGGGGPSSAGGTAHHSYAHSSPSSSGGPNFSSKTTLSANMSSPPSALQTLPSTSEELNQYGIALLAIAQFNGRVVAVYFPPRSRQSFIEQLTAATNIFSSAFKGSGFI